MLSFLYNFQRQNSKPVPRVILRLIIRWMVLASSLTVELHFPSLFRICGLESWTRFHYCPDPEVNWQMKKITKRQDQSTILFPRDKWCSAQRVPKCHYQFIGLLRTSCGIKKKKNKKRQDPSILNLYYTYIPPGSYQRLDLFIKVLRVFCPNLTDASKRQILYRIYFPQLFTPHANDL